MIEEVQNRTHLERLLEANKDFLSIIFYSNSSEKSKEALRVLKTVKKENLNMPIYAVNAAQVRDIHPLFGINTVPTVLVIKAGKVSKVIDGLQSKVYYERLLFEMPLALSGRKAKKQHRVIVYTSPHCPWCGRLKSYLRENQVPFREIDVSSDERAASELVRRSGQMGTPQTDIDGRIVVGFDQGKLDNFLGLRNN